MSKLIIMCGIPASGKSTSTKQIEKQGFLVLSADKIREKLHGDAGNQKDPETVFRLFYAALE